MTNTIRAIMIAMLVGAGLALASPAAAHESHNHGTIKVHDDEVVDPATRNDPQVSCAFWIEGFDMSDDSGFLEFYAIPPTSNPPVLVLTANWTADAGSEADGFHFNEGPFNLPPGHYKVEAYVDEGLSASKDHKSKSKVFRVNPCLDGQEPPDVPCPPDVTAVARGDGSILVDWGSVAGATEYRIYRAVGGGDFDSYASVIAPTTEFVDTDTVVGTTYRYVVTAVVGGVESEFDDCPVREATAIPFFPSIVATAVAALGGAAAFVLARRR